MCQGEKRGTPLWWLAGSMVVLGFALMTVSLAVIFGGGGD
jgi:hypothetical protein